MLDNQPTTRGFFQRHHQNVRSSVDDITLKNFTNLEDDRSRVQFVSNIPQVKNFDPKSIIAQNVPCEKDADKARVLKNEGNAAVQAGNWKNSLYLYTQSYLYMPKENRDEIAVIVANRSASLYHLHLYDLALTDINLSLSLGYPKDLQHKIFERKAKCYLALKLNREAILAFRETIVALDNAKLPRDKCSKKQTDAQVMVEVLEKSFQLLNAKNKKVNVERPKEEVKKSDKNPIFTGKSHKIYESTTDALNIESSEYEGRYAVAVKDIPVGEVVLAEKPHCNVLLYEYSKTHCQNCFVKCAAPVACPNCANVIFCSDSCKVAAMESFHKYECSILHTIWESGCSITCHMALRIISQRNVSYYIELQPKLKEEIKGQYLSDDYRRVYNLVKHETVRSKADFFQRTHMAVFLLNLLKSTDYFSMPHSSLEIETYIGELILKNLQVLQFNAHEIFELQCPKDGEKIRKDLGKSTFLGGGLYPTLALFNHSCDPGVVRYFQGSSVIVRTIKNIKKGQQVSENYGPIFTQKSQTERKSELRDQYWFDCRCVACEQKWPMFEDMNEGIMRFKCDAGSDCQSIVEVPINCEDFLMKCSTCLQFTNIMKGLKALQDTEMCQKSGKNLMESSEYKKALVKFLEELNLYDGTLAPPFKDYHLCQQNIRRCLLTFGNVSIV